MSLIIKAARFAEYCHQGQQRKYNGEPYITHPIRVAGRVATHPIASENLVAAAFLHDVMEDCGDITREILVERFNEQVASYVEELTNTSQIVMKDETRAERKKFERERLSLISRPAKIIKLIDRIDNLKEIDPTNTFSYTYAQESFALAGCLETADEALAFELRKLAVDIMFSQSESISL